ncbi:MAG: AMP-dependent synthetase [Ruminococcaceae bacterium]|nr:AMP-dependent synthetase [Oscillospiraceae bacterium]
MAKKNLAENYPYDEVRPLSDFKQMLDDNAERLGNKPAFKFKEDGEVKEVSYTAFKTETDSFGTALCSLGVARSHIAIVCENCYKFIVSYLTVLKSEGVFVPIDKELPANEIANIIINSDSEVVIYSKKYEEKVRSVSGMLQNVKYFIALDDEENSDDGKTFSYKELMKAGYEALQNGDRAFLEMAPKHEDLKLLVYTSGTTGTAKGVMLSLHNLVSCVYYGLMIANTHDVALSVLPYHHTYESVCSILVNLHNGSTICINESIRTVSANMKLYKPQIIMLVPLFVESIYKKIWSEIENKGKTKIFKKLMKTSNALLKVGIDMRKTFFKSIHDVFGGDIKKIVCGGAPVRQELGEFFETCGITLTNGYGITECSPLVSVNRDYFYNFASAGVALPCVELRIDNPNEDGEGEICVKGDTVMMGYYKMPELTAEVLEPDGWFHTGDYGRIDEVKRLYITGRKKNLIVLRNGKNIYPEEIEDYIMNLPLVGEVIVSAAKNDNGEEVGLCAEILPDEKQVGGMTDEEIYDKIKQSVTELNDKLPQYKHVHNVVIRKEAFDKTTTGKIKRNYNK